MKKFKDGEPCGCEEYFEPGPFNCLYDSRIVKGEELIRKIRRLGMERGVPVRFDSIRGKGSHGRLYYGDRFTTVKDRKEELGRGLLAAMLKQLGLTHEDIAG